jgi:high-affinity Fe2+/Pb2+ permease
MRGHYYHAFIAFVAVLSEGLVITLGTIPFGSATTHRGWIIADYITFGILGVMILAIVSVFFRRRKPALPRQPHTLASHVSYLCASRMLDDLKGTSLLEGREFGARVRGWGKTYTFGRAKTVDGGVRWAVDEL